MITKAGSKIFNVVLMANNDRYYIPEGTMKAYSGDLNTTYIYYVGLHYLDTIIIENTSGSSSGVLALLGVGDTPATIDDYCLDNMLVGGVDVNTIVQCTSAQFPQITTRGISYRYSFTNTGSSAITIKEICICFRKGAEKFMLARKVIPPRTIQPNENVTFAYEIDWF